MSQRHVVGRRLGNGTDRESQKFPLPSSIYLFHFYPSRRSIPLLFDTHTRYTSLLFFRRLVDVSFPFVLSTATLFLGPASKAQTGANQCRPRARAPSQRGHCFRDFHRTFLRCTAAPTMAVIRPKPRDRDCQNLCDIEILHG
jgi:hypothetical protein